MNIKETVFSTRSLILCAGLLAFSATSVATSVQPEQPAQIHARMVVFLAAREPSEARLVNPEKLAELQAAHLANIRKFAEDGLLYLAGPISSDDDSHLMRGILVFGPPSMELRAEVEKRLEDDPLIAAGFLVPQFRTLMFEAGNSLQGPIKSIESEK